MEGRESVGRVARNIGISRCAIKDWLRKNDKSGTEGLKESHTWKRYFTKLKIQAVQDYLVKRLSSIGGDVKNQELFFMITKRLVLPSTDEIFGRFQGLSAGGWLCGVSANKKCDPFWMLGSRAKEIQ